MPDPDDTRIAHMLRAHEQDTRLTHEALLALAGALVCFADVVRKEKASKGEMNVCTGVDVLLAQMSSCVLPEVSWGAQDVCRVLELIFDSGASTHLATSRDACDVGSVVACDVEIVGVKAGEIVRVTEKGDVTLMIGGVQRVLRDVLIMDASIAGYGSPGSEPAVLIGVRKFAADTNLGVYFPQCGNAIELVDDKYNCVARAASGSKSLYVVSNSQLAVGPARISFSGAEVLGKENRKGAQPHDFSVLINTIMKGEDVNGGKTPVPETGTGRSKVTEGAGEISASTDDLKLINKQVTFSTVHSGPRVRSKVETALLKGKSRNPRLDTIPGVRSSCASRLYHARTHNGNSDVLVRCLKAVFGPDFVPCTEPCDACEYAKARMLSCPKQATTVTTQVGYLISYDLFTHGKRSKEGYKYALIAFDGCSKRSFVQGLRKKSGLFDAMRALIVRIETELGGKVSTLERDCLTAPRVSVLRSDNAKENLVTAMKDFCRQKGITMQTSVAYAQWQNGAAEQGGGRIMKGGKAMQLGGHLGDREWFACVKAFNYVRNRTPHTNSLAHNMRTPYELWNDVTIPFETLIQSFRVIGSLCYVTLHETQRASGDNRSYRAMMMGYAHDDEVHQKAYVVRDLTTGETKTVAFTQVKFFEDVFPYAPATIASATDYDVHAAHAVYTRAKYVDSSSSDDDDDESDENDIPDMVPDDSESSDDDSAGDDDRDMERQRDTQTET
jgi:hypothetical protein